MSLNYPVKEAALPLRTLLLLTLACLLLVTPSTFGDEDRRSIVATTTQAADLLRVLTDGLDDIELTALMGAGVDPHLYQPTESDIVAMNGGGNGRL